VSATSLSNCATVCSTRVRASMLLSDDKGTEAEAAAAAEEAELSFADPFVAAVTSVHTSSLD